MFLQSLVLVIEARYCLFGRDERVDRSFEEWVWVGGLGEWCVDLEEGAMDRFGLVRYQVNVGLVCYREVVLLA